MALSISVAYIRELVDFCGEIGVSRGDLLRGTGVPAVLVENPEASLSRYEVHRVLARAVDIAPAGMALQLGQRMRPGHHGYLGHAMMCARTLRESLKVLERFAGTRGIPAAYHLAEDESGGELHFDLTTPVGRLRRDYLEWALMIALSPSLQHSRPAEARPDSIRLDFPEPVHASEYQRLIGCPVRFDAGANVVEFSRRALATELVNSNAEIMEFCERRCELILAGKESDGALSSRVRNQLLKGLPPFPDALETARSLHMSARVLRRRLREEGTSFRVLVQEVRRQLACRYLGDGGLTVDEVSRLLGYSEPAAFSRAFKSWIGQSPSDYRACQKTDRQRTSP
jgi:AraC-like DNA-binding protein